NVPSLEELGVKDAVSDTFQGIYAPAGTPKPVIDRLAKELTLILNRPDVREKFVKAGLPVVAEGPEVFRARIAREVPMYKDIIDKAGLKIQWLEHFGSRLTHNSGMRSATGDSPAARTSICQNR